MKIEKALTFTALMAGFFHADLYAQPAAPDKPTAIPRAADGKPDLSGVFSVTGGGRGQGGSGPAPERISFQPWADEKRKILLDRKLADEPTARCLSAGIVRLTTTPFFPVQFVQTPVNW